MGSVTAFIIAPFLIFFMLFNTAMGTIRGTNDTKVELPYDPSNGVVWECDKEDYHYFKLKETTVKGDKQIFVFQGRGIGEKYKNNGKDETEYITEVVFTDKNGNEIYYYAAYDFLYASAFYDKFNFYGPDDYRYSEYIPKAENEVENGYWIFLEQSYEHPTIAEKTVIDGESVFTLLFIPDNLTNSTYSEIFVYKDANGNPLEKITVQYKLVNGEIIKGKEKHEFKYRGDWVDINPELLDKEVAA